MSELLITWGITWAFGTIGCAGYFIWRLEAEDYSPLALIGISFAWPIVIPAVAVSEIIRGVAGDYKR